MPYVYDTEIIKSKLRAKQKLNPIRAVMSALGCSYKTAYNRLCGTIPFTLPEALKIKEVYFAEDDIKLEELFTREDVSA